MKSIYLLAIAYIKQRKTQSGLIAGTMGLAVFLFTTALGLLVAIQKPFDKVFNQLHASHILLYYDQRNTDEQEIITWAKQQPELESLASSCPMISIEQPLIFKDKEIKTMLQLTERQNRNLEQDKLVIYQGQEQQPPAFGEIWLPNHFATNNQIEIGDTLSIPVANGLYPLKVSATVIDPHFASALMNPSRAWVASGTLPFLFPSDQIQQRMLGIRLKDASAIESFWKRFHQELEYNGGNLQYHLFKSVFLSFYNILGGLLLIFSFFGIGLTLFIVIASLSASLLAHYQQTGVLKTIGFTPKNLQIVYIFQYLFLFFAALPFGLITAYGLLNLLLKEMAISLGLINLDFGFGWIALSASSFLLLFLLGLIFYKSWSIRKVKPAIAIRYGQEQPQRKWNGRLQKLANHLPLLWSLGFQELNTNIKRTFYTLGTLILAIFILNFTMDVSYSFANIDNNKPLWGFEDSDLQVQLSNRISIPIKHQDFMQKMESYEQVQTIMPYTYIMATLPPTPEKAPQEIVGKAFEGDLGDIGLVNLEGTHPAGENEIALCIFTAQQQQKQVGDSILLFIEGQHANFKITAIYQDISNMGQGFRLSMDGIYALNPIFEPSRYAIQMREGEVTAFKQQLQSDFSETIILEQSAEERKEVQGIVQSMQGVLTLLSLFFLLVLFAVLFSDTLMNIQEKQHTFGVLKTIGTVPTQLKKILVFKQLIIFFLAFIISMPFVQLISQQLISRLTAGIGLVEFPFLSLPFSSVFVVVVILFFVIGTTWWASGRLAKLSPKVLIRN